MLKPIDDYYPMSTDYGAKGRKRQDPKLADVTLGSTWKITYADYKPERPHETIDRVYYCSQINRHGVYFFRCWEVDRVLALTWVEILEMLDANKMRRY